MGQKTTFLSLMTLAALAVPVATLSGQEPVPLYQMRVEPAKTPVDLNVINLRPNAPAAVAFYLKNLGEDLPGNAVIKLVRILDEQPRVLAQAVVKPGGKDARLVFVKDKDAEKLDLGSPPFVFQLWFEGGKKVFKKNVDLRVRGPSDFVTVTQAQYDKSKKRLQFKVKLRDSFVGAPRCKVDLVLGPELKETKKGTFSQTLTEPEQEVDLFAEGAEFVPAGNPSEGRVYLTVDGYERAFTYISTLKESGNLAEVTYDNKIGARLVAPQYAVPAEKFPVTVELDGALELVDTVEIGLDRAGKKEQFQAQKFPGLRKQKLTLTVSPAGDLVFQADVRDWQTEFNTADVFGPIWFRIRVLRDGKEVSIVRARGAKPFQTVLEDDPEFPRQLFSRVILDGTPPEDVAFIGLPKEWARGKPLEVKVAVASRPKDRQAPIDKAIFFQGKLPADGKINPDAVLGEGELDAKTGMWKALIPVSDKKESLEISVQLTTRTGLQAAKTALIFLKDAGPATGTGAKAAKVTGTVAHGPLGQPNMTVTLTDAKGVVKGTVTTNKSGDFVFQNVAPGNYTVSSTRAFPALIGQAQVSVPEGQELVDNVQVKLKAK